MDGAARLAADHAARVIDDLEDFFLRLCLGLVDMLLLLLPLPLLLQLQPVLLQLLLLSGRSRARRRRRRRRYGHRAGG